MRSLKAVRVVTARTVHFFAAGIDPAFIDVSCSM
jgi:hypothetical protein